MNKPYSAILLDSIVKKIKRLLQHKGFIDFDVQVAQCLHEDGKTMQVHFDICMARKRELMMTGVTFFSKEQILDHLLLYAKSTWHFPASLIVDEIEQLYKSKGFFNVKVNVRELSEQLHCFIQAGSRAVIGSIIFKNNNHVSSAALLRQACASLLRARHFDQEIVKKTEEKIIKMYQAVGFWDAKIAKTKISFLQKNKMGQDVHQVLFDMQEGVCRLLGSIEVLDYPALQNILNVLYATNKSKPFNINLISEQKQKIAKWLRAQGYQKFCIEHVLKTVDQYVNVVWKITVSDITLQVGKTIILGNSTIKHALLMQEMKHKQGQLWSKKDLETTLQNLKTLPVFDSVQLYPFADFG